VVVTCCVVVVVVTVVGGSAAQLTSTNDAKVNGKVFLIPTSLLIESILQKIWLYLNRSLFFFAYTAIESCRFQTMSTIRRRMS
jgi:hypothetical protein